MLPERRSTIVSSLNPSAQNDQSLRRGKKFGRIVRLKLSHLFFFFLSLFFFSCIFSGHKLLFHGSDFLPHSDQNPHTLMLSELDLGLNKTSIQKPPGSKKRNKHLPCEVALAKEKKQKELAELEALLADFGVTPKENNGKEDSKDKQEKKEVNGEGEKKENAGGESKAAKQKKKKEEKQKEGLVV